MPFCKTDSNCKEPPMSLEPIFSASWIVQLHVYTVVPAALLGAWMLLARKGTSLHKLLGRVWVGLMGATAMSSFFITELRMIGPFSPIHLLSVLTLVSCVVIVWSARTGMFEIHKGTVQGLYFGGIGVAGLFTLLPGRIMHEVVFGANAPIPGRWMAGLAGAVLVAWLVWRRSERHANDLSGR